MAIVSRIANLFHRSRIDREIDAELRSHIALRIDDNVAAGMTPAEARRDALVRFGNPTAARDRVTAADAAVSLESVLADIRYALRQLARAPGFATVAILTLALGIGANTAVFSVTNTVLLRPLKFPRPDRIVQLEKVAGTELSYSASIPLFLEWRDRNRAFQHIAAYSVLPVGFNLAVKGRPERVLGLPVSADFFRVLGIEPNLGRNLTAEDDREGAQRVAVISESLWHRRYGDDAAIVGKQISLDGEPAIVIGVLPRGFQFLATLPTSSAIEIWTPLRLPAASRDPSGILECIGRLRDGVSPQQAAAQMTALSRRLAIELPAAFPSTGNVELLPLQQRIAEDARPTLLLLLGATGLVLLIACANVANLLAARMPDRAREISVRAALGAGRLRIVRQLLTESLLLALCGGVTGIVLAVLSVRILLAMAPLTISRFGAATLDWRVLLFATFLSVFTGVLFGVLPALRTSGTSAVNALHAASVRRATRGRDSRKVSGLLMVAETALSLVLLAAAGLLIESFLKLQQVNPGFNYRDLTTFETTLPVAKYADPDALERFVEGARQSIERLPDVENAAAVSTLPTQPTINFPFTRADGPALPPGQATGESDEFIVSPAYFKTMQIPLLEGRAITDVDQSHSHGVVVINRALASKFFPGESAIGKRIVIAKNLGPDWADETREVVGVVGDARAIIEEPADPSMYVPFAQVPKHLATILLRTVPVRWAVRMRANSSNTSDQLGNAILSVDSSVPVAEVKPMAALMSDALERWRFNMLLLGAFAGIALALAAIGIYGLMSHTVAQRTQEIGVRMALGAERSQVLALIVKRGMSLACSGAVLGIGAALLLMRLMRSLLFGVSPADPAILAAVSLLLIFTALVACVIPARRAASIDPMRALRNE
jgi:putative ABC transport system permease protein